MALARRGRTRSTTDEDDILYEVASATSTRTHQNFVQVRKHIRRSVSSLLATTVAPPKLEESSRVEPSDIPHACDGEGAAAITSKSALGEKLLHQASKHGVPLNDRITCPGSSISREAGADLQRCGSSPAQTQSPTALLPKTYRLEHALTPELIGAPSGQCTQRPDRILFAASSSLQYFAIQGYRPGIETDFCGDSRTECGTTMPRQTRIQEYPTRAPQSP